MRNLCYFFSRSARLRPDRVAVLHGDDGHTYAALNDRVGRLAQSLLDLGLQTGDRLGIIVDLEPRGLEALLGPLRAGLVLVPMNPKLHAAEHAYMLGNCGARALISSRAHLVPLLRQTLPDGMVTLALDGAEEVQDAPGSVMDYERALTASTPLRDDAQVSSDDLAWIFYTSGTTGRPKGAMLTHRNLITMVNTQLIEINPVRPDDRQACLAPLSHSTGLMAFQHLARGAALVFPTTEGFRPRAFYEMVERHRITTAFMVPTMIQRMLDEPNDEGRDLSSLHTIMYGGAPMYVDRVKEAVDRFGAIFVQGFAQGEAPMGCTYLPKQEHRAVTGEEMSRLGSAGRECHLVEVRVFDDADRPVAPGTPGEIVVRGDLVMKGYWNNPDATAETLRNGWLHTGDIGYLDEDGYLFITDRKKDMIISGGSNIYPRELEEVIYQHPAVREATVFGVPHQQWGEQVVAAIVLREGADASAQGIINWCRDRLASFKKPSAVHFVPELPKSGYGKILKREIRNLLYPERAA